MTVQRDGKIVVVGARNGGAGSIVWRLLPGGGDDNTFGVSSVRQIDVNPGNDEALTSVTVLPDDRIMAAGWAASGAADRPIMVRLTAAGALDTSFSTDGMDMVTGIDVADSTYDSYWDAVQWIDGTITWVGKQENGANDNWAIVKYDSVPVDDYNSVANDDWDNVANTTDLFGACLRSVAAGAATDGTTWSVDGGSDCGTTDTDTWYAIPAASPGAKIAQNGSLGDNDATVNLRFGVRTSITQPAGIYTAPIIFETVAPNGP
jgi:uncharacterized delta-60 repeat protein